MQRFAPILEQTLGARVADLPGAGAAGGLGAALMAFLGARLQPGVDLVMQATDLHNRIKDFDLVITGEGRLDSQSINGKVCSGVARIAAAHNVPVAVIAGSLAPDADTLFSKGNCAIEPCVSACISLPTALQQAAPLLTRAAERLLRSIELGRQLGIATPYNEVLTAVIRQREAGFKKL